MFKIFFKPFLLLNFLLNIKIAVLLRIFPSFKTLKLFARKVSPVLVISDKISDEPVNGYTSVAPRDGTNLN